VFLYQLLHDSDYRYFLGVSDGLTVMLEFVYASISFKVFVAGEGFRNHFASCQFVEIADPHLCSLVFGLYVIRDPFLDFTNLVMDYGLVIFRPCFPKFVFESHQLDY
jgi:hypothetical protein